MGFSFISFVAVSFASIYIGVRFGKLIPINHFSTCIFQDFHQRLLFRLAFGLNNHQIGTVFQEDRY
jgi:hypothetical protein